MPTLKGVRERFDYLVCETRVLEPGQVHEIDFTLLDDHTQVICGLGLRVLDTTQQQEQPLLDHYQVTLELGLDKKQYGPYPGTVLSTFRVCRELASKDVVRFAFNTIPGYVLLRPVVIPVRLKARMLVSADHQLKETRAVRVLAFGLRTRDYCP